MASICCRRFLYRCVNTKSNLIEFTTFSSFHTTTTKSNQLAEGDESESFGKYAQNWWNEDGEMKALHSLNFLRVPFIRDCLLYQGHGQPRTNQPLKGVNLLDVGCGVGLLSEPLTRMGANVVGIDTNEQVLQVANTHKEDDEQLKDNLQYLECYVEDLVEVGELKFDCIVASEVIEHVPTPQLFVQHCVALLKPGGSLMISTINRNYLSYLLAILLAENVFMAAPKGTHEYDKFVTPGQLAEWLQQENCSVNKIHGMQYLPIINKWLWSENTQVNYILHATKVKM